MDDKLAVIGAVLIITVFAMFLLGAEAADLIGMAITGLFGVAVGNAQLNKQHKRKGEY